MGTIENALPDIELDELAAANAEFAAANAELQDAPAPEIVEWALERFGNGLTLASSFQDLVMLDVARQVAPGIEVVFLDTGFHFPETLAFVDEITARWSLNLTVLHPGPEALEWPCGSARCCELRKVAPLRRHMAKRQAWMTGVRRADAATRANAPVIGYDESFGVAKVNPLAHWSDEQVLGYTIDRDLPVHPLVPRGYLSIGCAPTTRPVRIGEGPRDGRWAGTGKTECGLHG